MTDACADKCMTIFREKLGHHHFFFTAREVVLKRFLFRKFSGPEKVLLRIFFFAAWEKENAGAFGDSLVLGTNGVFVFFKLFRDWIVGIMGWHWGFPHPQTSVILSSRGCTPKDTRINKNLEKSAEHGVEGPASSFNLRAGWANQLDPNTTNCPI